MNTQKTRAVVYCRVSTDKEEQKTSIKSQRTELRRMCEKNGWYMPRITVKGLADDGVYYDIGTSGTKLRRPAFDRLLIDAGLTAIVDADTAEKTTSYKREKAPKFDLIVVKDASRFSRNVSINSILQALKDNDVFVYFLDLNMTTEINEHWTIIQQYFIFAESESRRKSTAVSWGYQAGLKEGKIYCGGKMFGYDYDPQNNKLKINEQEAEVIRRVFDLYTEEDLGQERICRRLAEEGHFNSAGKRYGRSTIKRWLQNEKYCGITTGGRYHKPDLFSKKRIERDYNDELRIAARNAQKELEEKGIIKIEPIISVEQFEKAQQISARNAEMYHISKEWHGTTDYSKKVVCGCCGAYYKASGRRVYARYGKEKICRYVCKHSVSYDEVHGIPKCTNPSILEPELDKVLFGRKYWNYRKAYIEDLIETGEYYISVLERAINADNKQAVINLEKQIEEIGKKRERLLDLYADGIFSKDELIKRTDKFTEEIRALTVKKEQLAKGNSEIEKDIALIKEMAEAAKKDHAEVLDIIRNKKYPKKSRRELLRDVEKITIDAEGKPQITFKSLENIKNTLVGLGVVIDSYSNEEIGWEEEVAQAEEWGNETGFLNKYR